MKQLKRLFTIDPWKLTTTDLNRENMRLQESLTSIGNGYMGMRGNFEEDYSGDHHQGTYLAGIWYPDKTRVGWWKNGYPEYFGKVINAINFSAFSLFINDTPVDLALIAPSDFYLELDMKNGVVTRSFTVTVDKMTVRFQFERFLSLTIKEAALIKMTAEVLNGAGTLRVVSRLDNNVHNEDSNYEEMFWEQRAISSETKAENYLTVRTADNAFGIERFVVTSLMTNTPFPISQKQKIVTELCVSEQFDFKLQTGDKAALTKQAVVLTSRDIEEDQQVAKGLALLDELNTQSFEEAKAAQAAAWAKRWALADVVIEGDDEAQQGIRFNLFQLFSTYYGEDPRLNIGPKGFTGEKYGGATYWDTEAYAVPLYLALADPKVTENLLTYRHNQLPQAKHNAQQQGLAGALYPMVTFTGVECHNEWEITFEEIHRNGAIPYAIYNYTNYTGDTSYLAGKGLEVLTEVARFWADRVHYSKKAGKYMIHGVTGPNEYENNVNNNWYTNTIAAWVLKYTLESYQTHEQQALIKLTRDEQKLWQDIIENMYYPFDEEQGIFVQHDTFLDKELKPVAELAAEELPLNQNWSWDKILRSCFIKQADVLQGIYFFGEDFSLEEKKKNFDFYEPMTVHESSLSPSIHAVLAAELGMEEKAVEMYQRTARLDLDNYNNDTDDGLHITSMTGSWLAIVQGFAQMKTAGEQLSFAPFLPKNWTSYSFHISYRGRLLNIQVQETITITLLKGEVLSLNIYGKKYTLENEIITAIQKTTEKQLNQIF
ncbi:glycoside hydrolase family 65 protein [Enterococcus sp. LJL51]|uniref:glycoside hydrolase family 65 protein n=1 Tax=Enterococcus sp. LJL51 TaxID=3416656 RepID=UPI003CEE73B8